MMFLMNGMDRDIILGLKALRNAHIPLSMEIIKKYLLDIQLHASVRITAAQALENFRKRKIEVLIRVFTKTKNLPEMEL